MGETSARWTAETEELVARAGSRTALADLLWSEIAAAGHTQAEMASTIGITQKHISRVVNGHDGMSLDLVDQILAACGRELILATRVVPRTEPTS